MRLVSSRRTSATNQGEDHSKYGRPKRKSSLFGLPPAFKLIDRLRRDATGSVAVEFALLGGLVIGLILETMQVGLYGYESAALARATFKASRMMKTGTSSGQGLNRSDFLNLLCSQLSSGMPCSNVIVNVQTATPSTSPNGFYSFVKSDQSDIIQPAMNNAQTLYCPGSPGSFIYVQVYYAMPTFSPAWRTISATLWQGAPVHFISARAVFRSEPYAATGGSC